MEENMINVYVKLDSNNIITEITSSIFLTDVKGYTQIDQGEGDKYSHSQGSYLGNGLVDSNGQYNYKLVDNKPVELTEEEKTSLFPVKTLEATQDEILRAKIIKDGVTMQLQIAKQQQINANLLTQIAKLTGGTK